MNNSQPENLDAKFFQEAELEGPFCRAPALGEIR
jgi:hypothetical protein